MLACATTQLGPWSAKQLQTIHKQICMAVFQYSSSENDTSESPDLVHGVEFAESYSTDQETRRLWGGGTKLYSNSGFHYWLVQPEVVDPRQGRDGQTDG